jgi:hypothetical protein
VADGLDTAGDAAEDAAGAAGELLVPVARVVGEGFEGFVPPVRVVPPSAPPEPDPGSVPDVPPPAAADEADPGSGPGPAGLGSVPPEPG